MSSGREVSVILPDQYTSSRREGSISSMARANSTRRSVPTRKPAPLSTRPKATAASSIGGVCSSPSAISPHPTQPADERAEADERLGPVEGLGYARWFVEIHSAHLLRRSGYLAGQPLLGVGDPEAYDLHLPVEAGVLYVMVEAAALERVVDLPGSVGGQNGDRRTFGPDGA